MQKKLNLISFSIFVFTFCSYLTALTAVSDKQKELNLSPLSERQRKFIVKDDENYITENQRKIDVLNYDIFVELFFDTKSLAGEVTITGLISDKSLTSLDLNFYENLKIDSISLNSKQVSFHRLPTTLSIDLKSGIEDTFKIFIKYSGKPKLVGFSSFVYGLVYNRPLIFSLSEPNYASTWFPCNDLPTDKALVKMHIKADSINTSVSNGLLTGIDIQRDKKIYNWEVSYPISTYLICLYSSVYKNITDEYVSVSGKKMPIEYYVLPEHYEFGKKDFEDTPKMISIFSQMFGEYPFINEKYGIAEFLWVMGAMEHQTITGIGYNFINGRKASEETLVHELAHHWWGNAIAPAEWKDIWLNEGFATYCEALYQEKIRGKSGLQNTMISKCGEFGKSQLYNPSDLFGTEVYDKGAWVLHSLRFEIGDSVFFTGMRQYYEKYKYKSASVNDFKKTMESVSKKDLNKFFDQWIYSGKGIISVEATKTVTQIGSKFHFNLKLKQVQKDYDVYEFPLQIHILNQKGDVVLDRTVRINKKEQEFLFDLDETPDNFKLDPENWLLIKIVDESKAKMEY